MSQFNTSRVLRLLQNDLLQQWKRIWITTLAVLGIALVIYVSNVDPGAMPRPNLYVWMFPLLLIGGGLLFTSTIFADLHHPLQRFSYLTLPCSNLERFISRYLLTAPLFYLYALVLYALFDMLAALLSQSLLGARAVAFAPFEQRMLVVTLVFFGVHTLMFCGAVFFRSHVAVKTVVAIMLITSGLVLVQVIALRIFYWNYFESLFQPVRSGIQMNLIELSGRTLSGIAAAFCLWVLYIGYQCLRDHEVQGEL